MAYSRKESMLGAHKKFVKMLEETFGCLLLESSAVDADALALARERDAARARKDFAESDRLRDVLMKMGYEVRDSKEGTQVKRK
jgi:cysteinyl-tRNA synthetase